MNREDEPKKKPTREEARKRKWLKRLRSFVAVSGTVVSGAVLLLIGRRKS